MTAEAWLRAEAALQEVLGASGTTDRRGRGEH